MSLYLDWKYLNQLNLSGYSKKSETLANFSCPICDELHNSHHPNKKRAYLIEDGGNVYFHCHRCGASMSAWMFIRDIDPALHKEYCLEAFKDKGGRLHEPLMTTLKKWTEFRQSKPKGIPNPRIEPDRLPFANIWELEPSHRFRQYVIDRQIPIEKWNHIYYIPKFMEWTNTFIPNKFDEASLCFDAARLVFPFYTKDGRLHAYQGRTLNPKSSTKYITIVLDETLPVIYGIDVVDWWKTVYVTEGPIDSMFLPNAIAVVGGDMVSKLDWISSSIKPDLVLVFDNEPRSPHLRQRMMKAIEAGYKVLFWPHGLPQKDINEMIIAGPFSPSVIHSLVQDCVKLGGESPFEKMKAILQLNVWSKA